VQPLESRRFIKLKAALTKTPDKLVFDFAGTDTQVVGSLNWPGSESYYAKFMGTLFKGFVPDVVINDGVNRVIECKVPPGTVLSPEFPAACSWRTYPLLRILDIGLGILAKASGGLVPASQESISSYGLHGRDGDGNFYLLREITGAGSGGRPFADGADTVDVAPESKNMPGEFAETFYPVRIEALGLRRDSGGPGKFRGGMGYLKDIRILRESTLILHADRAVLQPWGVAGGRAGAGTVWMLNPGSPEERLLPGKTDRVPVKPGDLLRVLSPGGGGWGDPLERDPEAVRVDVMRRLVSRESAHDDYGVVLVVGDDPVDVTVDDGATERLRAGLRTARRPLKLFDRGEAFDRLVAEGVLDVTTEDGIVGAAS
jgi:N-methylhydantoinase B